MDNASVLELLGLLGTFLCLLLAAFLIAVPSRAALANRLFAGFLLLTALDITGWFMDGWWQTHPVLNDLRIVATFPMSNPPYWNGFQLWLLSPSSLMR